MLPAANNASAYQFWVLCGSLEFSSFGKTTWVEASVSYASPSWSLGRRAFGPGVWLIYGYGHRYFDVFGVQFVDGYFFVIDGDVIFNGRRFIIMWA
jgi:hypothetical protein